MRHSSLYRGLHLSLSWALGQPLIQGAGLARDEGLDKVDRVGDTAHQSQAPTPVPELSQGNGCV